MWNARVRAFIQHASEIYLLCKQVASLSLKYTLTLLSYVILPRVWHRSELHLCPPHPPYFHTHMRTPLHAASPCHLGLSIKNVLSPESEADQRQNSWEESR